MKTLIPVLALVASLHAHGAVNSKSNADCAQGDKSRLTASTAFTSSSKSSSTRTQHPSAKAPTRVRAKR